MNFDKITDKNVQPIYKVESDLFKTYGCIVSGLSFDEFDKYMNESTDIPDDGVVYVASVPEMEDTGLCKDLESKFYGELPVQVGFCNGNNTLLNGLEYHKGNEILYAITDLMLILGHIWDINENKYDTDNVEVFYVQAGTALELYATTLHFAPCMVDGAGFKSAIVLPKGTNYPLKNVSPPTTNEDELLFAANKWLIVHHEAEGLIEDGAFVGLVGENLKIDV